jgi:hypothetical protein
MVHVDIVGLAFDIPSAQLLYGGLFLFLALLVLALWLRQGRNEALEGLISLTGGLGFLGGVPVFPDAVSTLLLLLAAVVGLLAVAHEMQRHGRNVVSAAGYVGLWGGLAYLLLFCPLWLARNAWLLQG